MKKVIHYCDFCRKEIEIPSHVSVVLNMTYFPNSLGIDSGPQRFWDGDKDMCTKCQERLFLKLKDTVKEFINDAKTSTEQDPDFAKRYEFLPLSKILSDFLDLNPNATMVSFESLHSCKAALKKIGYTTDISPDGIEAMKTLFPIKVGMAGLIFTEDTHAKLSELFAQCQAQATIHSPEYEDALRLLGNPLRSTIDLPLFEVLCDFLEMYPNRTGIDFNELNVIKFKLEAAGIVFDYSAITLQKLIAQCDGCLEWSIDGKQLVFKNGLKQKLESLKLVHGSKGKPNEYYDVLKSLCSAESASAKLIEITLAEVLNDFIELHPEKMQDTCLTTLDKLNACKAALEKIGFTVNFSEADIQKLIGECSGSIILKQDKLIIKNGLTLKMKLTDIVWQIYEHEGCQSSPDAYCEILDLLR